MYIAIPFEGRVRTLIRSSFLAAKRTDATHYSLTGESFQMSGVTAEQVILLPDSVEVSEGQEVTDELLMQALPVESFITVSADEALPNVLGLLLRQAVADGRISDAELLSVQPVLEGRIWRAGIAVQVGDVFTYKGALWRCIQPHTTQDDWAPDLTPAGTGWRSSPKMKCASGPPESTTLWATKSRTRTRRASCTSAFRRTPRRKVGSRRQYRPSGHQRAKAVRKIHL